MTTYEEDLLKQMRSWESGYISPSAQMLFKQARELLEERLAYIEELEEKIATLSKPKKKGKVNEQ
jgi:hypothetical protein